MVKFRLLALYIVIVPMTIVFEHMHFKKLSCIQIFISLKQVERVREESIISGLVEIYICVICIAVKTKLTFSFAFINVREAE